MRETAVVGIPKLEHFSLHSIVYIPPALVKELAQDDGPEGEGKLESIVTKSRFWTQFLIIPDPHNTELP